MKSQLLIDFNRAFDEHFIKEGSTVKSHYASRQEGVQFLGTFIRQHTDVTYSMDMEERIKIACEIVGLDTTKNGYPGTPYNTGDTHQWREAESIHKTIEQIEKTIKKYKLYILKQFYRIMMMRLEVSVITLETAFSLPKQVVLT